MGQRGTRILITGHEIGGQMQLLAETFRRRWFRATATGLVYWSSKLFHPGLN
jgi:hypothetical protein